MKQVKRIVWCISETGTFLLTTIDVKKNLTKEKYKRQSLNNKLPT